MILTHWNISVVISLFVKFFAVGQGTGQIPPLDVKVVWNNEFCPLLDWSNSHGNCNYNISKVNDDGEKSTLYKTSESFYRLNCMARDKDVTFEVSAQCTDSDQERKAVSVTIRQHPAFVKNFHCVVYSRHSMNCSWDSLNNTNIHLYYWIKWPERSPLKPCTTYLYNGTMKTGCHILYRINNKSITPNIFFLLNDIGSNLNNTFWTDPKIVKPDPPKLSVSLEGDKLLFRWDTDTFDANCLKYEAFFSKCGSKQTKNFIDNRHIEDYDPACEYRMKVKSVFTCGSGKSDLSKEVVYGRNDSSGVLKFVLVTCISVMVCLCIILFVLYRQYKDKLLPKIPIPARLMGWDSQKPQPKALFTPAPTKYSKVCLLSPVQPETPSL
ncbi:interleukin-13 receptor subunit alpha-1 isoform X1 [Denticeps clupeoides]|uniref:interleukin-13 receptor subunit alpha-1 isoform X1 n=1 Tax=Denticeps clupeoides TaxID=299321 RepID=UPI0010A54EB9|nr:granulocyte-macrophage colony-stimulating factor receptor subunit alpha-like isoform X1 [Denticeps clupeoides]